ncbi:mannose-1-phosphate guanylyltransferase, partial [Cetobacterium sp.]|uniref:mannose-1-phosphate guanylyltransferase n=1 Tax=Cetobacterium sp. TaxID=2071632 RepID=UPI003EE4DF45
MLTALIMAGGSGERFWPLSTPEKPKQLLNLFSNKSMIRETVDRILPIISPDKIFIATNILQVAEIKKELPDIPKENIIIEPIFKDTAAAIGYASLIIENRFKDYREKIEVVVLASDHFIEKGEKFCEIIKLAAKEANRNSVIVTLGIKPSHPETGYGYIEINNKDEAINLNTVYKVRRFREKPNFETAENYLSTGRYLWNSGIFIFTIDTIFKNFEVLMEEHSCIFKELQQHIATGIYGEKLSKLAEPFFQKFEKISIDFGIMEYSKNIRVIPVDIGWSDLGSFTALAEIFPTDEDKNTAINTIILSQDSKNNIIIAEDTIVSLLGVENLIIVKNKNNILITLKERTQDIKKIV